MDGIEEILSILRTKMLAGKMVLDAGCGDGRFLPGLIKAGWRVIGCDLSQIKLSKANFVIRNLGIHTEFQVADIRAMPYSSETFGITLCIHVLPYHFQHGIVACLEELWRILIPGGVLCADFLDREDVDYGRGQEIEPHTFLETDGKPVYFTCWNEIEEWFANWEIISLNQFIHNGIYGKRVGWDVVTRKKARLEE